MKNTYYANSMFGDTEMNMQEVGRGMLWGAALLIFGIGFYLTAVNAKYFLIDLKPAYTVEELMDNGAREGMHVDGEIPFIYDCFANKENFESNKVESVYYALPAQSGFLIVMISAENQPAMEKLLEETVEFMNDGSWPVSKVPIEGYVEKAQGRLPYLLGEYMTTMGYTQEQIEAMGEPLAIVEGAKVLREARIGFPIGIILQSGTILAVVFSIFRSKWRNKKKNM